VVVVVGHVDNANNVHYAAVVRAKSRSKLVGER